MVAKHLETKKCKKKLQIKKIMQIYIPVAKKNTETIKKHVETIGKCV